ncbi:hypothetical protein U6R90_12245, partial [Cutibacterium acnes]
IPLVPMFRIDGQSYHAAGAVVPNIRFLPGDKLTFSLWGEPANASITDGSCSGDVYGDFSNKAPD